MDIQFQPSFPNRNDPDESHPCLNPLQLQHLATLLTRAVAEGHVSITASGGEAQPEIASSHQIKIEADSEGLTFRLSNLEIRRLHQEIE